MDKIDKTIEIQEENQPTKPLGTLLKSYRESAAMDYDQAANMFCLSVATLKALENEQFDVLPEAPYIRGYLRSYAKLAHVSSAEAIARYEEIRGGSATAANLQYNFAPTSSVKNIIKPAISPLLMRFGLIAVVLLLLAVISMLPDVREWSTGVWTEFSQKTVATEAESSQASPAEGVLNTAENTTNTHISKPSTSPPVNTVVTSSAAETTMDNPNTTQAALNNMDGKINRKNQFDPENTPIDSATSNTENAHNVTPSNNEKTGNQAPIHTTETRVNTVANTPVEPPPIAANTASTAGDASNATATTATTNTAAVAVASTSPTTAITTAATNNTANNAANTTPANVNESTPAIRNPDGSLPPTANNTDPNTIDTEAAITTEVETIDPEAQAGEVTIKLVFTKEVWMRVDSEKKKVFSGLKKSGDTEEFTASKPLSFKVGNAPGVEIYINGQRYDQTPHTRGAVSRFKIEDTP